MTYSILYFRDAQAHQISLYNDHPNTPSPQEAREKDPPVEDQFYQMMKSHGAACGYLFNQDGTILYTYFKQK